MKAKTIQIIITIIAAIADILISTKGNKNKGGNKK
jgi:hypothetical protein